MVAVSPHQVKPGVAPRAIRALERRLTPRLREGLARVPRPGGISGLCWKRQVLLVPGGYTPGNSRLGVLVPGGDRSGPTEAAAETAAYTALAGEASARPAPGGCNPGQFAPWVLVPGGDRSGPTEAGSRDGGLTPRLRERLAHVRAGGVAPRAIRACGPGPRWGTVQDRPRRQPRRRLNAAPCAKHWRTSAPWVSGDARRPGISPSLH